MWSMRAPTWNAATASASTYYGDSAIFTLPAADGFGQAELDFVPTTGHARTANTPSPAPPVVTGPPIPTLSEWGLILLAVLVALVGGRKIVMQRAPVPG